MKASDLRIGNWCKRLDNTEFQISGKDISQIDDFPMELRPKPIELNAEWLVKFGFQYSESKEWLTLVYRDWKIDTDASVDFSIVYADVHQYKFAFARTVHELQNLYFVLTQTELQIIKS
jgi:hypothetical protein